MKTARAFTLIELLVVIIVIAVMAGVVVPAYSRFYARSRFEAGVGEVQDLFAYAREQAITQDSEVTLTFDSQAQMFVVKVQVPPPTSDVPVALADSDPTYNAPQPEEPHVLYPGEDYVVHIAPGGATGGAATGGGALTSVHFHGDGTSDGAEVFMLSRAGYQAHLLLLPATGRLGRVDDSEQRQ